MTFDSVMMTQMQSKTMFVSNVCNMNWKFIYFSLQNVLPSIIFIYYIIFLWMNCSKPNYLQNNKFRLEKHH